MAVLGKLRKPESTKLLLLLKVFFHMLEMLGFNSTLGTIWYFPLFYIFYHRKIPNCTERKVTSV